MSTPEINLQLDNFLEQKGLLGTKNPTVGPPAPTIQQSFNSSLDSFLKYKGYQIPGELPDEKPPEPTTESLDSSLDSFLKQKVAAQLPGQSTATAIPSMRPMTEQEKTRFEKESFNVQKQKEVKERYGVFENPKVNYYLEKIAPRLPMFLTLPSIGLIFEALQQAKNIVMSLKDKAKYDPLAERQLSEMIPEDSPGWLKALGETGEYASDMVIAGIAGGAIQEGLFKRNLNRLFEKAEAVGWKGVREKYGLKGVRARTIEEEINRGIKIEKEPIPSPPERGMPSPISAEAVVPLGQTEVAKPEPPGAMVMRLRKQVEPKIAPEAAGPIIAPTPVIPPSEFSIGSIYGGHRYPISLNDAAVKLKQQGYDVEGVISDLRSGKTKRVDISKDLAIFPLEVAPAPTAVPQLGPTVAPEGAKVPVGKTVIDIKPQPDGTIRVEVAPAELPQKPVFLPGTPRIMTPESKTPPPPGTPTGEPVAPPTQTPETMGKILGISDFFMKMPIEDLKDYVDQGNEAARAALGVRGGEIPAPQPKPRIGPTGETLGEFRGAGYQGLDKEQVKEDYRKWLESRKPSILTGEPPIEVLPPGEAYNIRKDAEARVRAEADYAKNLRAGTIERVPKPEVPAVQFTDAEKTKISKDITYLTSGSKTPGVWRQNPEQIDANRNELIKQALLKLPVVTPEEIKKFVNNYAPNIKGERLQTRKEQKIAKETQYPLVRTEEGTIDISENVTAEMLPTAETGPKGKPPAGPRLASERAKDIFTSEQEEVRVIDALSKAAGGDEKVLEILKSKLLADVPETDLALSKRIGVPKSSVSHHFRKALAKLKDSEEIKDIMKRHFVQMNVGPLPGKEQLKKLAKFANKFFTSTKGVDRTIDRQNDKRLGAIAADAFEQTLNIGQLFKWIENQKIPGLEGYLTDLVTGARSGDGYTDIANSNLPAEIKDVLTAFRKRTDALSDMIVTEADVTGATKDAFDANMGKYLHKYYRLYEDKAWSPSDQQKAGFKKHLMETYGMTADEAEASIEADLAYARNDELLKPRHKRNTKAIPAGSFIKRKALSPEWRAFAGEIDRATYLMIKTTTDQAVTAHNAKFLSFLSDYLPDLWTEDAALAKKRGWQHNQLPSTYRYGKLRGKLVSPKLQEYITREFDIGTSGMEKLIQKFLVTPYKWTKTIGSYPGHARNLMGNIAFSILGRCSLFDPLNTPYYVRSVKAHVNRGKIGPDADLWKSLIKEGITETQYWGSEIPRLYNEMLRFEPSTWLEKIIDKTIKWPIDKLGELYNFGDSVYRVASHLKNTEHYHMTPSESADEINITFQNYRKLPVAVDFLRRYPVLGPFVSFTWNLGKIVGAQATKGVKEIKSPATRLRGLHRLFLLLGVVMIPEIVSEISKKLNHFDAKQIDELEKYYPSYRRGGSFWYFRGENGEPRIFDMSYLWPVGNLSRPVKDLLSGDATGMLDALSFMNAPAIDAYQILVKGKDPQWGQEYPGFFDKVMAFAKLFYLPASSPVPSLPALLKGEIRPGTLTGLQFKSIIDAYNKQPYGKLQYEREFPTEIKNFVTGIRTWKLEPEKVMAQYIGSKRAEAQSEQSRFNTWLRDNWKAKDWQIKKKSDATAEKIKKSLADAEKAARLLHDLKLNGFKITDQQDYNFRKEKD